MLLLMMQQPRLYPCIRRWTGLIARNVMLFCFEHRWSHIGSVLHVAARSTAIAFEASATGTVGPGEDLDTNVMVLAEDTEHSNYCPHPARRGHGGYSGQSADIWSVGIVLFVFLYGYIPWDAAHERSVEFRMFKMLDGHVTTLAPWSRMPAALRTLLLHTMAVRPARRWSAHELQAYVASRLGWSS
eukprot:m.198774 g.198774  ORF g.198774 m.198774 type:complete len:186 (-) comp18761_c0_seq2:289-846(-)